MVDLNSKTLIDFILAWDFLIFEIIYMNFGIFLIIVPMWVLVHSRLNPPTFNSHYLGNYLCDLGGVGVKR
jgi:hypothetical protein